MRRLRAVLPAAAFSALVSVGVAIVVLLATLPDPSALAVSWPESTSYMRIRSAQAEAGGRRLTISYSPVPMARIPETVQRAVRVSEDAAFFQHRGFDWYELRQAVGEAWQEGKAPRGASTITQQLARNLYLSPDRSFLRKIREALITERLEARLSKRRIFELYLNVIEFGPGIFGVDAASRHYFGIPVDAIGRRQAAELAATIPAPLSQNPDTDSPGFRWRADLAYARAFAQVDTVSPVDTDTVQGGAVSADSEAARD